VKRKKEKIATLEYWRDFFRRGCRRLLLKQRRTISKKEGKQTNKAELIGNKSISTESIR